MRIAVPERWRYFFREVLIVRYLGHRLFPVGRRNPRQPQPVVPDEQRLDIGDVAGDRPVGGFLTETKQGAGDDVGEPPREFPECRGVSGPGQLRSNPGRHLGDSPELADRVVAFRDLGESEVKEVELIKTSRPFSGGHHIRQNVEIALGIEEDHDIAARYILAAHQVGEAGFADAGGAEYEQVADTFVQRHPHEPFVLGADAMQGGVAAADLPRFC